MCRTFTGLNFRPKYLFQVGTAAVQLARADGLTVIGTAGTEEGLKLVKEVGAHHVFNHREKDYQQRIMVCFIFSDDILLKLFM